MKHFTLTLFFIFSITWAFAAVIYVDGSASGSNNGSNWSNAYTDLQDALDAANSGDELRIAGGTYKPTESPDGNNTNPRRHAFHIDVNISISGGWNAVSGTQTGSETILSGDIGTQGNTTDNCGNVFVVEGLTSGSFSKFSIVDANGNINTGSSYSSYSFNATTGAGMFIANSTVTVTEILFKNNFANLYGGGLRFANSTGTVNRCVFDNNSTGNGCMGLYFTACNPSTVTNCLFIDNSSTGTSYGGAIFNNSTELTITNTSFIGNTTNNPGAAYDECCVNIGEGARFINCLFYENRVNGALNDIQGTVLSGTRNNASQQGTGSGANTGGGFVSLSSSNIFSNYSDPDGADNSYGTPDDGIVPEGLTLIAAGTTAGAPATDITGETRPSPPSIGAHDNPIIYVDHAATGSNDGSSWANAYEDLQDAINDAISGQQIRVAEGTYYPTEDPNGNASPSDPRDKAFFLTTNVSLSGGWDASTGTQTGDTTYLSGDIGTANSNSDNCYHVLIIDGINSSSHISSLCIIEGNANSGTTFNVTSPSFSVPRNNGAGVYINSCTDAVFTSLTIRDNDCGLRGGAWFNTASSWPDLKNSMLYRNTGDQCGGIWITGNSSTVYGKYQNLVISNNSSVDGGGMTINGGNTDVTLNNILFIDNYATNRGGAVYNWLTGGTDPPVFNNCSFINNIIGAATGGAAVEANSGSYQLNNCLFYGNKRDGGASPSVISGGTLISASSNNAADRFNSIGNSSTYIDLSSVTVNNIFMRIIDIDGRDNQFMTLDDGFAPRINSVLLGAGASISAPTTDITGRTRPASPSIGAYEEGIIPPIYVNINASGNNDGTSWANGYTSLQQALDTSVNGDSILVAEGTYKPTEIFDTTSNDPRQAAFHINDKNITLSGGWDPVNGNQTGENTILSGDIGNVGNSDNAYHIFVSEGQSSSSIYDKLVFRGGNGVSNCFITQTYLGGSRIFPCTGSGMIMANSSPSLQNCVFTGNNGANFGAVGVDFASAPIFRNCVWVGNTSNEDGAFFANNSGTIEFFNCTFYDNSGNRSGAMYKIGSGTLRIINCLFFNNSGPTGFNNVRGTILASGNNAADQSAAIGGNFVNLSSVAAGDLFKGHTDGNGIDNQWMTEDDGFMPKSGSDIITEGSTIGFTPLDIIGYKRRTVPTIGAYEGDACLVENQLPNTNGTTYTSSDTSIVSGWTNFCTEDGELLLSLKLLNTGVSVANSGVQLKLGSSTTFSSTSSGGIITNSNGYAMIDRRWNVTASGTATSNPGVRYYFTNEEYDSVVLALSNLAQASTITNVNQLQMYKATSGGPFADPHTVNGQIIIYDATTPGTGQWIHNTHGSGDHIAEFEVANFSSGGGGASGGNNSPLPVDLIRFDALAQDGHQAQLNWVTASEINNSHFIIERSFDGEHFEAIDQVEGNGNTNEISTYRYNDISIPIEQMLVFYRLQQVDFDGSFEYSPLRSVNFRNPLSIDIPNINIFPNPFTGALMIELPDELDETYDLEVHNLSGQTLYQQQLRLQSFQKVDLSQLAQGVYVVQIFNRTHRQQFRILKQ